MGRGVTEALETFRFNDAASALYRFIWNQFCDWYLELMRPIFNGNDESAKAEAQSCAAYVLGETYKLLHPFMPFMTEELWAHMAGELENLPPDLRWREWDGPGRPVRRRAGRTSPCRGRDKRDNSGST
ncbi:hypothetical protein GCM10010869_07940 [Mesorhizobium tianshanense]|uniref:valine--tRNA ligase n=1 Tax=Mesorhizobium tianshanense TaxID=39844 RepID=A0A562MM78_9HYPH|nr:valyl-tRNA synthetase [Mesorhizobium tianshanense]GLS35206.1 hypothetical protein GCM10010869_07940 [Mesorhizobium tianshanense]